MSRAEAGGATEVCTSQLDAGLYQIQMLAPSLRTCVALSKVLNLLVPQLPYL